MAKIDVNTKNDKNFACFGMRSCVDYTFIKIFKKSVDKCCLKWYYIQVARREITTSYNSTPAALVFEK